MKRSLFAALMAAISIGAHADDSYKAADAKLNQAYQEITVRLKDHLATKKLLVEAQRNWLRFRDAECALRASTVEGGSAYSMVMEGCLADLTTERVKDMQYYLSCEEGDLSCPIPR